MAVAAAIKTMSEMGNPPFESGTLKSFFDELGGLYAGRHDVVHPFLELVEKVENHLGHVLEDHASIEAHHIDHAHETEEKLFRKTFDYNVKELGRYDVGEDNSHHYNGDDNTVTKIARTEVIATPENKRDERENQKLAQLLRYIDTANNNAARMRALEQRLTEIRNEIQRLREENERHEKALKALDKAQRLLDDSGLNDQTEKGREKREKLEKRLEKAGIDISQFQNADGTIDTARLEEATRREEEQRQRQIEENNKKIEVLELEYSEKHSELNAINKTDQDNEREYAEYSQSVPSGAIADSSIALLANAPADSVEVTSEVEPAITHEEIEVLEAETIEEKSLISTFKAFAAGLMGQDEAPAEQNENALAANEQFFEDGAEEQTTAIADDRKIVALPVSSVAMGSGQRSVGSFAESDNEQEFQPSVLATSFVQASNPAALVQSEPEQTPSAPEYKAAGDTWKRQSQLGMAA